MRTLGAIGPLLFHVDLLASYLLCYREAGEGMSADVTLSVEDEICRVASIKMSGKLRAFCFYLEKKNFLKVLLQTGLCFAGLLS